MAMSMKEMQLKLDLVDEEELADPMEDFVIPKNG